MIGKILVPVAKTAVFAVEQNAGKILTGISATTAVAACASTAVATWKSKDTIIEHNDRIAILKEDLESSDDEEYSEYVKNEIRKTYLLTAAELACNYALPAIFLSGSVASAIGASTILSNRIATLAAGYATISSSYASYRNRVRKELGVEKEDDIYKGIYHEEVEYIDEKGKKKKRIEAKYDEDAGLGDFCMFWIMDENPFSQGNPALDLDFLDSVAEEITRDIHKYGYVSLEDAYRRVGIIGASPYLQRLWHDYGRIKSQERIAKYKANCEGLDEVTIKQYEPLANKWDWGISDAQRDDFLQGRTGGVLLLCPNIDGNMYANGATSSLSEKDIVVDEKYMSETPGGFE